MLIKNIKNLKEEIVELSELTVMVIIKSGIMIFFLASSNRYQNEKIQLQHTFQTIFKGSLLQFTFHKKALLALFLMHPLFPGAMIAFCSSFGMSTLTLSEVFSFFISVILKLKNSSASIQSYM